MENPFAFSWFSWALRTRSMPALMPAQGAPARHEGHRRRAWELAGAGLRWHGRLPGWELGGSRQRPVGRRPVQLQPRVVPMPVGVGMLDAGCWMLLHAPVGVTTVLRRASVRAPLFVGMGGRPRCSTSMTASTPTASYLCWPDICRRARRGGGAHAWPRGGGAGCRRQWQRLARLLPTHLNQDEPCWVLGLVQEVLGPQFDALGRPGGGGALDAQGRRQVHLLPQLLGSLPAPMAATGVAARVSARGAVQPTNLACCLPAACLLPACLPACQPVDAYS